MTSEPFPAIGTVCAIAIAGVDARAFAQAQFAGNVELLRRESWQWNAWLTPGGKVRALMHLVDPGDARLLMLLRGGDAEAVRNGLQRFVLRSRVTLATLEFTARAGPPLSCGSVVGDGGFPVIGLGGRSLHLGPAGEGAPDSVAANAWHLADIRQGWPCLPVGDPEWLPPALALERLGAVAFDKGCYPGQEIAARLHFRGGHKRALFHLRGGAGLPLGPAQASNGVTGWILDAAAAGGQWELLAVLPEAVGSEINLMQQTFSVVSMFSP